MNAIRQSLKINDTVAEQDILKLIMDGTIVNLYLEKFSNDRPSLKWMLSLIPKNCTYFRVK